MSPQPDFWQRQTAAKPLYPAMLWSRPENRSLAGKLLIIGGNLHGFASAAEAFAAAEAAGAGTVRVLLPDALAKTLGKTFAAGEFAPSTPSGSFSQRALAEMLDLALWADGVLIDGDLGRNSETAIVLEKFVGKYHGQLTLADDALDVFLAGPKPLLFRQDTVLAANFGQLQKLFSGAHFPRPVTSDMDMMRLTDALHHFSLQHHAAVMTQHMGTTLVAFGGKVSSTTGLHDRQWPRLAATAAVWWLQNPGKTFEALTTSLATDAG